jgi:histone H3/H4
MPKQKISKSVADSFDDEVVAVIPSPKTNRKNSITSQLSDDTPEYKFLESGEVFKEKTVERTKINPRKKIKTAAGMLYRSEIQGFHDIANSQPIIPKAAFLRLLKEVIRSIQPHFRVSYEAFSMIQEHIEHEISDMFNLANVVALLNSKVTVHRSHLKLAAAVKRSRGSGFNISRKSLQGILQDSAWPNVSATMIMISGSKHSHESIYDKVARTKNLKRKLRDNIERKHKKMSE